MRQSFDRSQFTILILEDDSSIAELLSWILRDAGYEIQIIDRLGAAREFCARERPDLIIADLALPDGLGTELLEDSPESPLRVRPPVIIMSALPNAESVAHRSGADLCLSKPFDLAEMLDAVDFLVRSRSRERC